MTFRIRAFKSLFSDTFEHDEKDDEAPLIYRNYWNISRPCIILDSKIPRLVLEVFPKVLFFGHFFLDQPIHNGPNRVFLKDLNFCQ